MFRPSRGRYIAPPPRESAKMYVWQLVSCRLQGEGWEVWHTAESSRDEDSPRYRVRIFRPGLCCEVTGTTLTDAYAEAARRAREHSDEPRVSRRDVMAPDLFRGALMSLD